MSKESLESNADARTTARRRLVRGVFAAPAALTLYSGSVAAASVSCVLRQQQTGTFVSDVSDLVTAAYVRVPIYLLAPTNDPDNVSKQSFWVSGDSLFKLAAPAGVNFTDVNSNKMTSTSWLLVKVGNGTPTSCKVKNADNPSDSSQKTVNVGDIIAFKPEDGDGIPTSTAQYLVVRIDGSGVIVGVERPSGSAAFGGTGSALSTSCWNSFNPAAIL